MSELVHDTKIHLDEPRYDQDTYSGRAKHFFLTTNPLNLLASDHQLDEAKKIVEDYRHGIISRPGMTLDELWRAKYLYDSAFHPDTKEKMFILGRMSAQVPCNMLITGFMLTFYKTAPAIVFWQFVNQSFNSIVNYTNRSGDKPITNTDLMKSYAVATTAATATALGLKAAVSKLPPIMARFVPFAAVAGANCVNLPFMRWNEIRDGIAVFDKDGKRVGESSKAAKKAIAQVVLSRIGMAVPGMIIPPIIMNSLEKKPFMLRRPWLSSPIQIALCGVFLTFTTPMCCALFPQKSSMAVGKLDDKLREKLLRDGMKETDRMESYQFVVIGGGISGVTCVESIATFDPTAKILLLTGTPLIKAITNYVKVSKFLEEFDIEEKPFSYLAEQYSNLILKNNIVERLDTDKQIIFCSDNIQIHYDQLCICSGARPKLLSNDNPYVLGIRDTETVASFQKKLTSAKQVVIIGNGGIATELVYEIEHCSVIWAIKDEHISTTFFDEPAARFFLERIQLVKEKEKLNEKRQKYEITDSLLDIETTSSNICGGALGPDWATNRSMKGALMQPRQVHIEYQVEVRNILTFEQYQQRILANKNLQLSENETQWPVYIELTNDKIFGCDFIVSAIGVTPNVEPFLRSANFTLGTDGGLLVDEHMRTSIKNIFACGDVCTAGWELAEHWFQMRLWSQARQMGHYAGKCMLAYAYNQQDSLTMDFCFELFAHTTKFFNMKVVLLGKYHESDMKKYENIIRMTPGEEYIRITLKNGRVHGCIFIGDTELEETFENLILNQINVSDFGETLLDPNIDIADYFD